MLRYVARRLVQAVLVVFVVVTISFYIVRLMPGNAIQYLEGELLQQGNLSPSQIQDKIQALYGVQPKGPLWRQYLSYIGEVVRGNLGRSITNPSVTVGHIIAIALPWTVFIVGSGLLISFVLGLGIGTVMAVRQQGALSKVITFLVSVSNALPSYLVAIILLYFLADLHPFFPTGGAYSVTTHVGFNLPFILSVLYHAILPIAAYTIISVGGWALFMKGSVMSTLGAEYVRGAESWGLERRTVSRDYIGRNALLPMVTNLALSFGFLFGGSVFIETYFSYPGLGYYLVTSVDSRDYTVMMGCFLLITIAVVVSNILVDVLYPLIDPRVTSPARSASRRRPRPARGTTAVGVAVQAGGE